MAKRGWLFCHHFRMFALQTHSSLYKNKPMFRGIFSRKWDPCLGITVKKQATPVCLNTQGVGGHIKKTRRFSNHESCLLSRSHTFAIIVIFNRFENTSKYVDTLTLFSKNLNQRSLTPRWPLTPCLLRSHVWLYPRIIVSKSHDDTSIYVDTLINFANYHIHTYTYYVHTTYYVQNEWSHSLLLNSVQARQKRNKTTYMLILKGYYANMCSKPENSVPCLLTLAKPCVKTFWGNNMYCMMFVVVCIFINYFPGGPWKP